MANDFLNAKQALVHSGELSKRTWADYKQVCDRVVAHLGKARLAEDVGPDDFAALRKEVAKRWEPQRLGLHKNKNNPNGAMSNTTGWLTDNGTGNLWMNQNNSHQ